MHLAAWLCSRIIFICRDRGGFSGGLLPVLPDSRPVRDEPVRRGSGNRCYGKSGQLSLGGSGFLGVPLHSLHQLCMTIFSAEILR